jgi:hypothetical protein
MARRRSVTGCTRSSAAASGRVTGDTPDRLPGDEGQRGAGSSVALIFDGQGMMAFS